MLLLHPLQGATVEQELDPDDCRSSTDLVNRKIYNHLVLSYSGAPYSIGGASSLQGARSSRWVLGASPRVSNN